MQNYCYADEEVIPQDYLEALYKEAEKYNWYATREDMGKKFYPHMNFDELLKMNKYIDNLFNNRTCLTVVNPPNLNLHFEQTSREYIKQLYRRLPEFQKGASSIYIEMLKQKARKLKRITELTHVEALDVAAQMAGWQNWKAVKVEDEAHARQLISSEKYRKEKAAGKNYYAAKRYG